MPALALDLLSSRLGRLQSQHESRLRKEHSDVLADIDVSRRSTVGSAYETLVQSSALALVDYCALIRSEVLGFAETTSITLSGKDIASLVSCASHRLDTDYYLRQFDQFGDAVIRHFGRAGQTFDVGSLSLDHTRARLDVATWNALAGLKSSLNDDLKLMQRKQVAAAQVEKQKSATLVPTWMGKWDFWLKVVAVGLTIAGTYRTFVPAPPLASSSASIGAALASPSSPAAAPLASAPLPQGATPSVGAASGGSSTIGK
jgi:hypothetical protein